MNNLQVFSNPEFGQVRTVVKDGEPWFVAKDVCDALEILNPSDALKRLDYDERARFNLGRQGETNMVNEYGLYNLILGSRKPEAKTFKRWITHEVIPSIRKHGGYLTPAKLEEVLLNPDTIIQLAQNLKAEQERVRMLELETKKQAQIINEMRPKATYYDLVLQSKSAVSISKIAKDYGMSGQALNKLLCELGVQYKQGGVWLLYQKYADKGYTQSKTIALPENVTKMHTNWTQKGRLFIYDLLKNKLGMLPIIEREQQDERERYEAL